MKLLLIEDHKELAGNISSYLGKEGYICEHCHSYAGAMDKLAGFNYDIVLLDLMLPDGHGFEILKYLKKENPKTGVLILSAKDSLNDRIEGLDYGADDYLSKPFHLSELNARLKAVFRRRNLGGSHDVIFNEISIQTENREVRVDGTLLDLTRKEYEMLLYMIVNKNRVLTKQSIAEHLWGDYMDAMDSFDFVYQHIKNLRKKITQAGGKDYIQTMYGTGYKFVSQ